MTKPEAAVPAPAAATASVETTTPAKSSEPSDQDPRRHCKKKDRVLYEDDSICRACSSLHPGRDSYPDQREPPAIDEDDDRVDDGIYCNYCKAWFHTPCSGLEPFEIQDIENWPCAACKEDGEEQTYNDVVAPHRKSWWKAEEKMLPTQVGSRTWLDEFVKEEATRFKPPPSDQVPVIGIGHEFVALFKKSVIEAKEEWKMPYLILNSEGIFDRMPPKGEMDIDTIVADLGADLWVETIDVFRQVSTQMRLGTFRKMLKVPLDERRRRYNILSLEFANTKLGQKVNPPTFVQGISWLDRIWPMFPDNAKKLAKRGPCSSVHKNRRPGVDLFCLLGMGGSFTDFHLDFGGTSVWYHVYRGKKIFYIAAPTVENLDHFQRWYQDTSKEYFLADALGDKCWRVEINEGQTLMIPGGWIHAVYTPIDSVVFGGNYLNDHCAEVQIEIDSFEERFGMDAHYRFHDFDLANYYGALKFIGLLKESNRKREAPRDYLLRGCQAMLDAMRRWHQRDLAAGKGDEYEVQEFKVGGDWITKIQIAERLHLQLRLASAFVDYKSWPRAPRMDNSLRVIVEKAVKKETDNEEIKNDDTESDETNEGSEVAAAKKEGEDTKAGKKRKTGSSNEEPPAKKAEVDSEEDEL